MKGAFMKSLFEFCRELNHTVNEADIAARPERYMDILLSLLNMIEEGRVDQVLSPYSVMVDESTNNISLEDSAEGALHYCPPEVIYDGQDYGPRAQLFSLGLIIFYIIYAADYYSVTKTRVLEIEDVKRKYPDSLIDFQKGENRTFPSGYFRLLKQIMKELTSWDPADRENGKAKLIRMYDRIDSRNRVYFMEGDKVIAYVNVISKEDIDGFPQGSSTFRKGENVYRILEKIDIPYRPGIHSYRIRVKK